MTLHFQCTIGSCHGHVMTGMTPPNVVVLHSRERDSPPAISLKKTSTRRGERFFYMCRNYHWKSLSIFLKFTWPRASSRERSTHKVNSRKIPKVILASILCLRYLTISCHKTENETFGGFLAASKASRKIAPLLTFSYLQRRKARNALESFQFCYTISIGSWS